MTILVGAAALPIRSVTPSGAHAVIFYKVSCPTCQMAAPAFGRFALAYPGRVIGVGQDPADTLAAFSATYAMSVPSVADLPPYRVSDAYGIEHVPTMVVVDGDGRVADVVESWDRDGLNRASRTLADMVGVDAAVISDEDDGLPAFRPG